MRPRSPFIAFLHALLHAGLQAFGEITVYLQAGLELSPIMPHRTSKFDFDIGHENRLTEWLSEQLAKRMLKKVKKRLTAQGRNLERGAKTT
jgi:hypothetical protein